MANRDLTRWGRSDLTPYRTRDPFSSFRHEIDRLFEDFFTPATFASSEPRTFATEAAAIRPSVDVREAADAYVVTAEVPGIDQKDIELNLRDNTLILTGEKRSEHDESEEGRRYSERSFGRFERRIPFEAEVDADRVEASCANGVLTITLPKNPKARDESRRIEIRPTGEADRTPPVARDEAGAT